MLVESRLESDPWKKYYPYRAIIELTDSTTMPQLKGVKASVITDLQKRSYGGRRLTRKNFGIRLGDLERAVLRSKGLSMREVRTAMKEHQDWMASSSTNTRMKGYTSTWPDRRRKRGKDRK